MKKKSLPFIWILLSMLAVSGIGCQDTDGRLTTAGESDYTVTLNFIGPDYTSGSDGEYEYVYAAWIEDADGNNLQNLYVCNRILGIGKTLTGVAIPYWFTEKYDKDHPEDYPTVDGVTGASTQGEKTITRGVDVGGETEFRVCFEIDRSLNDNKYFDDRPAFIYKSGLIDLGDLEMSYNLELVAYMPNVTLSGTWSQKPNEGVAIEGFEAYAYLTDLSYIEDSDGGYDDLVTSLTVQITEN